MMLISELSLSLSLSHTHTHTISPEVLPRCCSDIKQVACNSLKLVCVRAREVNTIIWRLAEVVFQAVNRDGEQSEQLSTE